MAIEQGINWLIAPFTQAHFFGVNWILQIGIIILTLVIITRHVEDWGSLLLPVIIGWRVSGLDVNYVLYMISIVIFALNTLSIKTIGDAVGTFSALGKRKEQVLTQFDSARSSVDRWKKYGYVGARREEKLRAYIEKQGQLIQNEKQKYGKLGYRGLQKALGLPINQTMEEQYKQRIEKFRDKLNNASINKKQIEGLLKLEEKRQNKKLWDKYDNYAGYKKYGKPLTKEEIRQRSFNILDNAKKLALQQRLNRLGKSQKIESMNVNGYKPYFDNQGNKYYGRLKKFFENSEKPTIREAEWTQLNSNRKANDSLRKYNINSAKRRIRFKKRGLEPYY